MQQRSDEEEEADIICLSEFIRAKLVKHTDTHTHTQSLVLIPESHFRSD